MRGSEVPQLEGGVDRGPSSYHSIQLLLCLRSQVMVELGEAGIRGRGGVTGSGMGQGSILVLLPLVEHRLPKRGVSYLTRDHPACPSTIIA